MERVQKLDGENILLVTNNVQMTPEVVAENRVVIREFLAAYEGRFVIIIDFTDAVTSFADTLAIIQRMHAGGKRQDINERSMTIFVGGDKFMEMHRDAIAQPQHGGEQIPMFPTVEAALDAARLHLEQAG